MPTTLVGRCRSVCGRRVPVESVKGVRRPYRTRARGWKEPYNLRSVSQTNVCNYNTSVCLGVVLNCWYTAGSKLQHHPSYASSGLRSTRIVRRIVFVNNAHYNHR